MNPKFPEVEVQLTGQDGNAFNIIGRVSRALKQAGMPAEATEFTNRAFSAGSYDELLQLAMETVTVH
jgi:hypothetical protein